MDPKRRVRISKFLSRHLRHAPGEAGLELDAGGWASIDAVLDALRNRGLAVTRAELDEVVATNDKQRFATDETGTRIRASQGHSVEVELELSPADPPAVLYHGTGEQNRDVILRGGLSRMRRHHVHLSADVETAVRVGRRHGTPLVFAVASATMAADGFVFFCSANGVWLVDAVPPQYLTVLEDLGATRP